MPNNISTFDENLKKLSEIAEWFDNQEEVDVEKGLTKIKEAASLLKESKKRLAEIENEFEEIKKEIEDDIPAENEVGPEETSVTDGENPGDVPF